ncbi:MAG: FHA domain-containing protein [Oceanicoccus sp.]
MLKLQCNDDPRRGIWLVGEKVRIGRDSSNDLVLDGLGIDPFHAEIIIENDTLLLKSRAGSCFVGDLPVDAEYNLVGTEKLRIGKERLSIIDSKHLKKRQPAEKLKSNAVSNLSTEWRLLPAHSKLENKQFVIAPSAVIGRSKACQFSIPYRLLSREHARLQVENGLLILEDLNSANGCFVNGERVSAAELKDGDSVAFAKLVFTVKSPAIAFVKPGQERVDVSLDKTMIRPAVSTEMLSNLLSKQSDELKFHDDVCCVESPITMKSNTTVTPPQDLVASKKSRFFATVTVLLVAVTGFLFSPLINMT